MARVGFVGLGHMGLPMAINLVKAQHTVSGYDLQQQALDAFALAGGLIAKTLTDVAQQEVIITMLQTGEQVKQVYLGEQGLLQQAQAGTLFIDCSTIDVATARDLQRQAKDYHHRAVDAPVSGGVAAATAGNLTFMVGGEEPTFLAAKEVLAAMGKKIIFTGDSGSGQAAKICNNMILGISMIAVSEGFILAEKLGLSHQKLFEVVNNASGQCWVMSKYAPVPDVLENVPANRDYKPGFAAAMMLKDLKLSQNSAQQVGVSTCLAEKATELYQQFINQGGADSDFSAIIKLLSSVK